MDELLSDLQADDAAAEAAKPAAPENQMMHHLEHQMLATGFTEEDAKSSDFKDAEQYEPALFKDKQFMKFTKATEAYPDQVLRYAVSRHLASNESGGVADRTDKNGEEDREEEEEEEILTGKGDKIDPRGILWISSQDQLDQGSVPNCTICGGTRTFEFQVHSLSSSLFWLLFIDLTSDALGDAATAE